MTKLIQDLPLESAEFDFGEGPVTVCWRPKASLYEAGQLEKAQKVGAAEFIIEVLFLRARTDGGVRMFNSTADRDRIAKKFDPDEVQRAVLAITAKRGDDSGKSL